MWDSTKAASAPAAKSPSAAAAPGAEDTPAADPTTGGVKPESDASGPGTLAKVADLKATSAGNALTLSPDSGFLASPTTTYPVFIDPAWQPTSRGTQHWAWVQEGHNSTPHFDDYRDAFNPGVGYQSYTSPTGLERYYIQLDTSDLGDKSIKKAVLSATQVHAADNDCAAKHDVVLHPTHPISESTTWKSQPWDWGALTTTSLNSAGGKGCPSATTLGEWTITDHLIKENWRNTLTFGLFSADESKTTANRGLKRFTRNPNQLPYIYVEYNRAPYSPWNLSTSPTPKNPDADGCGWLGATNAATGIRLSAWVGDPDGNQVDAHFLVHDWSAGGAVVFDSGWTSLGGSNHEATAYVSSLPEGHRFSWQVTAGDGDMSSSSVDGCSFGIDATPPSVPEVSSADYPPSGTLPGSSKHTGQSGWFNVRSTDDASGVEFYEYAFNSAIPVGGANRVDASGDGSGSISLTPTMWGTNLLRVQAVDRAGNRSQENTYAFYAPSDPDAKTVLGDITWDGRVDLVLPDNSGNLMLYPAANDPQVGGPLASTRANSPQGAGWDKAQISHRGGNGIRLDDLFAFANGKLYYYRNSLVTGGLEANDNLYFVARNSIPVARPPKVACTALPAGATCSTYATDWSRVRRIVAIGDVDTIGIPDPTPAADTRRYDLITEEDDGNGRAQLWLFHGTGATGALSSPTLISTADWANLSLIAPGDATGDGLVDLWARDINTGDAYQYKSRKLPNGTADFTALGDEGARERIATGLTEQQYPVLTSSGDFSGDDIADLWSRDASGALNVWNGVTGDGSASAPVTGVLSPAALGYPGGSLSIHAGSAPWKCLDANGSAEGSQVQIYPCWNGDNQHFNFRTDGTLRTLDQCVTADGPWEGSGVTVRGCTPNNAAQQWTLRPDGSIYNALAGRCLDDPTAGANNGVQLTVFACHGYPNQQWKTTVNAPVNLHAGSDINKCADANSSADGAPVQLYNCWNGINQRFEFRTDNTVRVFGKCLSVDGSWNGAPVSVRSCSPDDSSQQWSFRGDGTLLNTASGRCLDDPVAGGQNGIQLDVYDCHTYSNQRWLTIA